MAAERAAARTLEVAARQKEWSARSALLPLLWHLVGQVIAVVVTAFFVMLRWMALQECLPLQDAVTMINMVITTPARHINI